MQSALPLGFLLSSEQVNFRTWNVSVISSTLTISKEDILVGISGLNGREDWPWDPTDEMNFQWRPRSKILSENKDEKQRVSRKRNERGESKGGVAELGMLG